jgi:hypothetical protein
MKLLDLNPSFIRYDDRGSWVVVNSIQEAQGISFDCPVCRNHGVSVSFVDDTLPSRYGTYEKKTGKPMRWKVTGTGLHDMTIIGEVDVEHVKHCWHGHIRNGQVLP